MRVPPLHNLLEILDSQLYLRFDLMLDLQH